MPISPLKHTYFDNLYSIEISSLEKWLCCKQINEYDSNWYIPKYKTHYVERNNNTHFDCVFKNIKETDSAILY